MLGQPPLRFQRHYVWLIILASLDIMLTWIILSVGGREENFLAAILLGQHGPEILIAYKFPLVIFVVIMCEVIARQREPVGRRLAYFAIAISAFPVVWSIGLLLSSMGELPGQFLQ